MAWPVQISRWFTPGRCSRRPGRDTFPRCIVPCCRERLVGDFYSLRKWPGCQLAPQLPRSVRDRLGDLLPSLSDEPSRIEPGNRISNRTVGYQVAVTQSKTDHLAWSWKFCLGDRQLRTDVAITNIQPAHNALLPATAETGILSGALILWFLIKLGWDFTTLNRETPDADSQLFAVQVGRRVCGYELVDHFFWSLPQGLLLAG